MKRLFLVSLSLVATTACAKSSGGPSSIPVQDTETVGFTFNPNEVVPINSFTDFAAVPTSAITSFLAATPYGNASFLVTYQSNGLLAADGISRAAQTYRINPIVLLVGIEVAGQLIARTAYPQPTSIVDYIFGCGCSGPGACDAEAAGLDVQVACYANSLRTSLDAIDVGGTTAGGWIPGRGTTTLDGTAVTPTDASTAALYQFDPVVGSGSSGSSMFANVWALYTRALGYTMPTGPTGATALVGDACIAAEDCDLPNPFCAAEPGGGFCTTKCTGTCPTVDAFCASFGTKTGGYCLAVCSPNDPYSCRTGYTCGDAVQFGSGGDAGSQYVCEPPSM
jgi:hypothetical protein